MKRWIGIAALGVLWGCALHGEALVLRGAPASVAVALPAAKLRNWPQMTLALEGIQPEGDALVRLRVFVDRPDADARTPAGDPHCAGEITLVPRGDNGPPAPRNSVLMLPTGARAWLANATAARITLVPLSTGAVRIAAIRIKGAQ
jgi:hypothetical protein